MLDWKIQIVTDLRLFLHGLDQFIVDLLRVAVLHTDPADAFDLT